MPFRFVVVGAGLIGPRHVEHIVKRSDCEIFAVVDRSAKGPGVAHKCGALHFNTVDDMIAYCEKRLVVYPDAAIIATPNSTHAALGKQLASKGIHLLVEKPMAATAEDCLDLLTFCEARDVHLLVGHHRRFNPYIVATKKHMSKIGAPIAIQGCWALRKQQAYFDEKAWRRCVELGGGALLINLIHDLDLLQYLIGPIARVHAELLPRQRAPEGPDNHVDEGAVLTIRFANGCCGTFLCADNVTSPFSFEAGTGENPLIPQNDLMSGFYRIFGSDGTLSVPDLTLYHQNSLPAEERSWWHEVEADKLKMAHEEADEDCLAADEDCVAADSMVTPPPLWDVKQANFGRSREKPHPFDLQLEHFINLITGAETEVKCSGLDAARAMLCVEAVKNSIITGLPQDVAAV